MQAIINAIKDLYDSMIKKDEHLSILVAEGKKQLADLEAQKLAIEATKKDLALREEKVGVVENANATRIDAEKVKREADTILTLAREEQKNIRAASSEMERKALNGMKDLQSSIDAIAEAKEKLKVDRKALEAEKLSYKNDIIKSFDKR